MAFGNVIPIDEDVARQLVRRQLRFRRLAAALAAVWLSLLVPTLLFTPLPPIAPFAMFAVLVVLAEHRFVLFGDETSMSASIIVIVASIFVFADTSPLAAPMLIASLGGLYLPQLRSRDWAKATFNTCGMGIAASVSAGVALAVDGLDTSPLGVLIIIASTAATYWVINNLIVAGHQATLGGRAFVDSARSLVSSETDVLVWGGAASLGAVASGGDVWIAFAFIAVIVGLRIASCSNFVFSLQRRRRAQLPTEPLAVWLSVAALAMYTQAGRPVAIALGATAAMTLPYHRGHPKRIVALGLPISAVAAVMSPCSSLAVVAIACVAVLASTWMSPASWTGCLAIGVVVFGLASRVAFRTTDAGSPGLLIAAVLVPPFAATLVFAVRSFSISTRVGLLTSFGLLAPSRFAAAGSFVVIAASAVFVAHPAASLAAITALVGVSGVSALPPGEPRSTLLTERSKSLL